MEHAYADVVVDISSGNLDRTFQYRIPDALDGQVCAGKAVRVPFGAGGRMVRAYVVGVSNQPKVNRERIKEIDRVEMHTADVESKLMALAVWMKETYGSAMIQALKTVLPMKREIQAKKKRMVSLTVSRKEAQKLLWECESKHRTARARLLQGLLEREKWEYQELLKKQKLSSAVLKAMAGAGVIAIQEEQLYREVQLPDFPEGIQKELTVQQKKAAEEIWQESVGRRMPCLIHGITGSGKTRVYMELTQRMLTKGKQVIVLIPEIALTYQAVWQFRRQFGKKCAVIHSRMSQGERWDAFEAARQGSVSVMVGPRSALFTPFPNLGMVIIDEEHESSYKSEGTPKYHAREVAAARCEMEGAQLVLGSATPALESYYACQQGQMRLIQLTKRFGNGVLPIVYPVDMREELRGGNVSIFSRRLQEGIEKRLEKKEQTILFLNRRGYAGFVSCRSCGYVAKCPHCDVSLSQHGNGTLVCHYCGYTTLQITKCPVCGSGFIGGFKAGTEQVEQNVKKRFPSARVLRMDLDTTRKKDGYQKILTEFASGQADILIGTQMIIKGHDFPGVTLVGVLAADLSLCAEDYRCAERTFQLLVQAVGRAGRGALPGEAVIQTYHPDHYSIQAACSQDYEAFYQQEIGYRTLMDYPPSCHMMAIQGSGEEEGQLTLAMEFIAKYVKAVAKEKQLAMIGPADETVAKIQDRYRKVLYLKHPNREYLACIRRQVERYIEINQGFKKLMIQFDFQI